MELQDLLAPSILPVLIGTILMLLLSAFLLLLDFSNRPNRVFALYLVFFAMGTFAGHLRNNLPDLADRFYWANMQPYLLLPILPAIVYFALIYPRPRLTEARLRWAFVGCCLGGFGLELAYLLDHGAIYNLMSEDGRTVTGGDHRPLWLGNGLGMSMYAALSFLLVRDFVRSPHARNRRSWLLVALAFALRPSAAISGIIYGVATGAPNTLTFSIFGVNNWIILIGAIPLLSALAVLARSTWGRVPTSARRDVILYAAALLWPVTIYIALPLVRNSPVLARLLVAFPQAFQTIGICLLVGYALAKYTLFGVDLRVRLALRTGIFTSFFVAVLVIVAQIAQNFLSGTFGWLIGGAAAGLFLFAARPLRRLADDLSLRAMPVAGPKTNLSQADRHHLYLELAQAAWINGSMSKKERRMLDVARTRLGLDNDAATTIERQAAGL